MNTDLLANTYFHAFVVSFAIGYLFGNILHALLRAPRWLVGMLNSND